MDKIQNITKRERVYTRDEMNLAEFPLTVLSTRVNSKIKTLEFNDVVRNKKGKDIQRAWIITGADKFGLPTSSDDEVLLGLIKLTADQKFDSKRIEFTRYELLKILRWTTEGKNYQRLHKALDRLSGVRIKATNAFFDNENKAHSTKNFGIIDAYAIYDGREVKHKPSFFLWSDEIFSSFKSGFIKKLDLDFYLDLKSSISKRIYRFLDKHFWYRTTMEVNLFTFAHEKIGVSRNYAYASSLKQQIDPALEELLESGFIISAQYQGKGKNTKILFTSASNKPRKLSANSAAPELAAREPAQIGAEPIADSAAGKASDISEQLVRRGLKAPQVQSLMENYSQDQIAKAGLVIKYYDYLVKSDSSLVKRSALGFLYRAVEKINEFNLPKSFEQQGLNMQQASPSNTPSVAEQKAKLESQQEYDCFISEQVGQYLNSLTPDRLALLEKTANENLKAVKKLISAEKFAMTVKHNIEQAVVKKLGLPDVNQWGQRIPEKASVAK